MHGPTRNLTPLIELASNKSLDLFFRVGQGYVARTAHGAGFRGNGHGFGISPFGLQSQAEARIISTLRPLPHQGPLHAWPAGNRAARPARHLQSG